MQKAFGKPIEHVVDGENNAVEFDVAYPIIGDPQVAIEQLKIRHGNNIYLLPMSGTSAGGGVFQVDTKPPGPIVGLKFDPPANPRVSISAQPELAKISLDEIVIDPDHQQVIAGGSITLDQMNQALARELGHSFKVPGADLTSYRYAAVGATFMTGGMGPQRRYFSDSVIEISLYNGTETVSIEGDNLGGYAGTYGWTGIVCALRCNYYRFPQNEVAFALPVPGTGKHIAMLLEHLSAYCYLNLETVKVTSRFGTHDLILGIEHVSRGAMQPLLKSTVDNPAQKRAASLYQKCLASAADGLVFINGYSDQSDDEFLLNLADDQQAEELTIAGIGLEFAEIFNDAEEMRAVREAIPYAARTQVAGGRLVYRNHSDANIRITTVEIAGTVEQLWQINRDYVASVEQFFVNTAEIDGEILVYGHLNPYGVDPHNRVTMSSDHQHAFEYGCDFLIEQRARYYRSVAKMCNSGKATFIGGEKTADSEIAIYRALGGPERSPAALFKRFKQQRSTIRAAATMFNWRAPEPYI